MSDYRTLKKIHPNQELLIYPTPMNNRTDQSHTLKSNIDRSANFISPTLDGGFFESRYVRRADDYIVVYLSSHSGCNQGCRFCHLTATRQTMMTEATPDDFIAQAQRVIDHYRKVVSNEGAAQRVHFNWMARGEPLSNQYMVDSFEEITHNLGALAREAGLVPIFNISTIFPKRLGDKKLSEILVNDRDEVNLYYSLYSLQKNFRRRWLPTALAPDEALPRIAEYQQITERKIVLHWAVIEDENDTLEDADAICTLVKRHRIKAKFNLVRYNPYSEQFGRETSEPQLQAYFDRINKEMVLPGSRIIPRVGFDVQASCGMFVDPSCTREIFNPYLGHERVSSSQP